MLFAFLPPISILPRFENSIWPGSVKSSKLPVGISVTSPIKGTCGSGGGLLRGFEGFVFLEPQLRVILDEVDAESSEGRNFGRLGEFLKLADSRSVANVVRLSLIVVDGASPESLLTSSCIFEGVA